MIEVRNLTKRYGDLVAVDGVSFTAKTGEILGFLGPNGAGKTTTMRIITGFMPATAGTVTVEGFDIFEQSHEVRKRIGYLPENPPLYNDMTVTTYLNFVARIKVVPRADIAGARERVLESCALTNVALLEPGEAVDSDRIVGIIGPNVMASVYYFYDEVHERGIDPPPFLRPMWPRYCALVESTPREHRHFRTHEFHYTRLHPGEAELIDADLIRATCLVGTADELVEQIRELEQQGLQELMFATGTDAKWRFAQEFARRVMPRV